VSEPRGIGLTDSAELVYNWRRKIIQLLTSPVEADARDVTNVGNGQDVENPEAEYYAEALKAQGDGEMIMECQADRQSRHTLSRMLLLSPIARVSLPVIVMFLADGSQNSCWRSEVYLRRTMRGS